MKKDNYIPYLFLLPAIVGLFTFKVYPMLNAFWQSLHSLLFMNADKVFVGLQNYLNLFDDPIFWTSMRVTLIFNVFINPIMIILAFASAILLNQKIKGITFFRGIQFVPVAVSVPTACILWGIMLSPELGVVNSILDALGFEQQPFLTSGDQALGSIIGIVVWKSVGYWAIFMLAGLQEVPHSLYEASSIDGATKWNQFKNITYPMMKRPITFVAVAITSYNFLLFSPMYILTQGGPQQSTSTLMLESYNSAFFYSDPGRASSIVVILLLMTFTIIAVQFKFLKAKH